MDKNYQYFKEHLISLVEKYNGKYIVIKNEEVLAAYNSFDEAYVNTSSAEPNGSYIIQHCTKDALDPTANFAFNNVLFACAV